MKKFPFYKQADAKDCGPTCLKIVAKHFGKTMPMQDLRKLCKTERQGSSLLNLSNAAEEIGLRTLSIKASIDVLKKISMPCILFWDLQHYVVLFKFKKGIFFISDPGFGILKYTEKELLKHWVDESVSVAEQEGVVLLLEPTSKFYRIDSSAENESFGFKFLTPYVLRYKEYLWQLILGLIAGSAFLLVFPFLTQSIVDVGIANKDLHFIYLILFAQLALFLGRLSVDVIRGWILLHLGTRINISLISDFFVKLMNLPISFFDTKMTGDILQRINDHSRIQNIMTTSSLNVLFSLVNLIVFGIVLIYYNWLIFTIFVIGSILYFGWILIFLKKRKTIDYKMFSQVSQEQSKVIELINGMQTIKMNNAEKQKRWGWEFLQVKLFKISMENLALEQYQNVGSQLINEVKNIIITVVSAKLVIEGEITLGVLLAISYIVGQLDSPIGLLINFIRELQDAKISLDRLAEIHDKEDEEQDKLTKIMEISPDLNISLNNISFKYPDSNKFVLENLNLLIPANKVTAIVGVSGSGKTTLMKLLLKFYDQFEGELVVGKHRLHNISQQTWRSKCGVVMQEDYIFNDSVANNIAVGQDYIDQEKLDYSLEVANIKSFIEELPLSHNTKIGMEGVGLSTGQKQRLLIARAVYKNPDYLFFDEATSSLDANNEKVIMEKLNTFFKNKTVVVIAHRLSTVRNAQQIVVLDDGKISEIGNHADLIEKKGKYYSLVKNQLELGK